MAPTTIRAKNTDPHFAAIPAETRPTALAVGDLVRRAAPDLVETMCRGVPHWAGKGCVLYLADYRRHVNLGFRRGAETHDASGFVKGTGKGLRHVKVRVGQPVPEKALVGLIRRAVALDRR